VAVHSPPLSRLLRTSVLALAGLWLLPGTAAAHGVARADDGIALVPVLAAVTALGVATGVLVASGRGPLSDRLPTGALGRTVGPLLVGLGVVAVVSALARDPLVGVAGIAAGSTAGAFVALRGGCSACADAAVGAVAVHRLVEGLTLAVAAAAGSSLGGLAVVVLAGHTIAECLAVGGHAGFGWRRAVGAVLFVEAAFVGGAALGSLGLSTAALPSLWVTAVVGGLLLALGATELRPRRRSSPGV
jgi:hypothetical protein